MIDIPLPEPGQRQIQPEDFRRLIAQHNAIIRFLSNHPPQGGTWTADGMGFECSEDFGGGGAWPGYGYVGTERYIDADHLDDPESELSTGTAITDNSSGVKKWIKVSLSADTVTFEANGPASNPHGVDEVWFYVPHLTAPFYVSRTG